MTPSKSRHGSDSSEVLMPVGEYIKHHAKDADIALWRPTTVWGWGIALWTYDKSLPWLYSHVTLLFHSRGTVVSEGLEEKAGRGSSVPLLGEVARWPGKIHVYRVKYLNDDQRAAIAIASMRRLSASYGWPFITVLGFRANVIGYLFARLLSLFWLGRRLTSWAEELEESTRLNNTGSVCSSHAHGSFKDGTQERWFSKAEESSVTPNDIGASVDTEYFCTLVWDESGLPKRTGVSRWQSLLSPLLTLLVVLFSLYVFGQVFFSGTESRGAEKPVDLSKYGTPDATGVSAGRYLVGYDGRTRCPRWVLERLDPVQVRVKIEREGGFRPDTRIPSEFRAGSSDYAGSGFDIGHMAPFATHRTSEDDGASTFVFSNAAPQRPEFNRGLWRSLEAEIRSLAETQVVYVVTCPLWIPQDGKLSIETIGPHCVWVPTHCGKAILVENQGKIRLQSWVMPNVELKGRTTDEFVVTTDQFETVSGLDVWSGLPDKQEVELEAK